MSERLPSDLVADLFRHRYAALLAGLCRVLGPARLDLAEDVLQEALLRALRTWPARGVPEQPEGWVFRVARNAAFDALRRRRLGSAIENDIALEPERATDGNATAEPDAIADDTLRMLFLCSHPDVPADARVPLLLKNVCGLTTAAIARALLQKEATIAQRLVRAKAKLQQGMPFTLPTPSELPARLDLVLAAIYLLFNEGYRSHAGERLLRGELIDEAVRLCALVQRDPRLPSPRGDALLALMLLLGARSPARSDANGELLPLALQDRSRWHQEWLACGFDHFRRSLVGDAISAFHVEAAIASLHASAMTYAETDWRRILAEYDRLLTLRPSSIVRLNRAVAVGKVHGAAAALRELEPLLRGTDLEDYLLGFAVRAQLHWECGDFTGAAAALRAALQQPGSEPEHRLLQRRLLAVERGEPIGDW
jgi:RNA polymerase sigma-70 factor, ECF subfamily